METANGKVVDLEAAAAEAEELRATREELRGS